MYPLSLITALSTLYMIVLTGWLNTMAHDARARVLAATAGHLAVYSSYVGDYARTHPGFTGAVADAAISYPTWFKRAPGEANFVSGGVSYTYLTPSSAAEGMAMARVIGGPQTGIAQSGTLVSPGSAPGGRPLPATVPSGAVVTIR